MHIIHGHWSMAVVGQRLTNVHVFVAVLDQDSETQLPASDTMPVAATQTPRQPSQAGPFHNYQKRGPDGKPKEKPKGKRTDSDAVCLAKDGKTQTRKKDTPKTVRGTDKKGHVRGTGKKDMPKTSQGPSSPKCRREWWSFRGRCKNQDK